MMVKTKGEPMGVLYRDMCDRVRGCDIRLQYMAAQGNKAAMLAEARALQGQVAALVELLEGELRVQGRIESTKYKVQSTK